MKRSINNPLFSLQNSFFCLNLLVSLLYVGVAVPFYSLPYEVPDYFKYYGFAQDHLPAKDGFSSLFIAISGLLLKQYALIHWLMLFLTAASLWMLNYSFSRICNASINRLLFLAFTYSMGCWYYFYGKVFYEFPFIAFIFALMIFLAKDWLVGTQNVLQKNIKSLRLFSLLAGLCLSWKAHALFPIVGLVGLLLNNREIYRACLSRQGLIFLVLFLGGYTLGNFNLIFDFMGTVQGIRGYKANTNILEFLFSDTKVAWDHINLFSFNTAIYTVWGSIFILFIAPFFLPNVKPIIFLNVVVTTLFLVVMTYFLSGLTWQAFPFALFFAALMFYILANVRISLTSPLSLLFLIVMGAQYFALFGKYLPLQYRWMQATNQSIDQLERNQEKILSDVKSLIAQNGPTYRIDLRLKRNWPDSFSNPLQVANSAGWNPIFKGECVSPCMPTYQIFIEPIGLYKVDSYQKVEMSNAQIINGDEYVVGWKKMDSSFIDQELYLLRN